MPTVSDDIGTDGQLTTGPLLDSVRWDLSLGDGRKFRFQAVILADTDSGSPNLRRIKRRAGREGIVMARYAAFAFL